MGLSSMMQGGLEAVGGTMAKIGTEQLLTQQKAEIEALRDARLSEMRLAEEQTIADRKVSRDATERTRIEGEAQGMADAESSGFINSARSQYQNADMSEADKAAGLAAVDAAEAGGAYKRAPTNAERLQAKGDYTGAENVKNLERDNARLDSTFAAETEHRSKTLQETIRHNKQIEANQPEKISPAARAQLEMASTYVTSAHRAEAEAAKALEAGRKDPLASPEKISQLERDYQTSKAAVTSALKQYDQIGASHFGEQWKKIEAPTPADTGGKLVYGIDGKLVRDGGGSKPTSTDKPAPAPATKAGVINERSTAPDANDYANVEAARAARKAKADREAEERTEKQRKRGEEIDAFNARMRKT